jgi:hypothetical protein
VDLTREDQLFQLVRVELENAFGVEFAGEPGAALTVAGIVVFVLSLAVMQEREQKHDLHVRSGCRVPEF